MKRYVMCPIIGTGLSKKDAFRPKVADMGVSWNAVFDRSKGDWCVVVVSGDDLSALDKDPEIITFADDTATLADKQKIINALAAKGVVASGTKQDVLQVACDKFNADASKLDV